MDCGQVRIEIAAYAFGGLDSADWQAVTRHLADCEPCRAEQAGYEGLVDLMATVRPWEAAPGVPSGAPRPEQAVAAAHAADAARDERPGKAGPAEAEGPEETLKLKEPGAD